MAIFSEVRFYKSLKISGTAYTENGLHRCAPLPTPDNSEYVGSVADVNPKNRLRWSEMVVPMPYDSSTQVYWNLGDIRNVQPSFITVKMDAGSLIYGWIDSIQTNTYLAPASNFIVRWHVDWWLTMGAGAAYKAGRLKRGPSSYARPDPSTPRKWVYDSVSSIFNDAHDWCIFAVTHTENDVSCIRHYFWQPSRYITINGNQRIGPSLSEIYAGRVEETLNLDPDTIQGAWISPIVPHDITLNTVHQFENGSYGVYYTDDPTPKILDDNLATAMTTDSVRYEVQDPTGAVVGILPWGFSCNKIIRCVDIGTAGANLVLNFYDGTGGGTPHPGEGLLITAPLFSVPITSNAQSSYNYSGQRAYDMETKRIQNEQALVSGIANAGTSAIGGAIAGGNAGPAGAAGGAAAGLVSAIMGSAINYELSIGYNAQQQSAVDRLMSNQANNVIANAGGMAWNTSAMYSQWRLVKMTRDSVSLAELSAEQSELGYLTDTQVANCTSIISGKGGLRIEGLEVLGIGPEGSRYISQMFAKGVHLD